MQTAQINLASVLQPVFLKSGNIAKSVFNITSIPVTYDAHLVLKPCVTGINIILNIVFTMFGDFKTGCETISRQATVVRKVEYSNCKQCERIISVLLADWHSAFVTRNDRKFGLSIISTDSSIHKNDNIA